MSKYILLIFYIIITPVMDVFEQLEDQKYECFVDIFASKYIATEKLININTIDHSQIQVVVNEDYHDHPDMDMELGLINLSQVD